MTRVFEQAERRGLRVTFALDIDTESANPQTLLSPLPESALIHTGGRILANPDTPEGYAFYKAQLDQLLTYYPRISRLALWFRNNHTPWTEIRPADFPAAWKRDFHGPAEEAPYFALARVIAAWRRALTESGNGHIELAAGSWRLPFVGPADRYLPSNVTLIPLDWAVVFDTAAGQRDLRQVRPGRRLIPIVWAHHDDRTYIGRPYTPFVNFASLLRSTRASGFGIIHWTTRPLDPYFRATIDQIWSATRNQPLEAACDRLAGPDFGRYLFTWLTEAPQFGRETTDAFIDVRLADPERTAQRARARMAQLARLNLAQLPAAARRQATYYLAYESFIARFFDTHAALQRARDLVAAGNREGARAALAAAHPEDVIRAYAGAAQVNGPTRGEQAIVISLNLRWLPYFVSLRQALDLEPVRYRLGKVEKEPLAQGAGSHTFYFDARHTLWRVIDPTPELELKAILNDPLPDGLYRINNHPPVESRNGSLRYRPAPGETEIVIRRAE
jgi:hypothetical protein